MSAFARSSMFLATCLAIGCGVDPGGLQIAPNNGDAAVTGDAGHGDAAVRDGSVADAGHDASVGHDASAGNDASVGHDASVGNDSGVGSDSGVPPIAAGYTETRYPIVLVHGAFGFQKLFGIVDYWYKIPGALGADGAKVFVTDASAIGTTETRGEQIIPQIETILAMTGAEKVNIIGHSQGGLDARYIATVRPDLVASVTTVAGVHKGTKVADFFAEKGPLPWLFLQGFGKLIELISGSQDPADGYGSIDSMTTAHMTTWNMRYPDGVPTSPCGEGDYVVNGIRYFSWSGGSVRTNLLDPSDLIMAASGLAFGDEPSDGVVGTCSSHLGQVIRDNYDQNHIDEINHVLGSISRQTTPPPTLYRAQANRLKLLGL